MIPENLDSGRASVLKGRSRAKLPKIFQKTPKTNLIFDLHSGNAVLSQFSVDSGQ